MASDKPNNGVPPTSVDTELAKIVVDRQLATTDEVVKCRGLIAAGQQTLADVLIAQNVVTRGQIDRIKKAIQDSRENQIPGYQIIGKAGCRRNGDGVQGQATQPGPDGGD